MKDEKQNSSKKDDFPDLTAWEFKFIRENSGISREEFAKAAGKKSRTTIYNWECEREMKPWQIKILMNIVPPDVFAECRRRYKAHQDWIQSEIEKRDRLLALKKSGYMD